MSQKGIEELIGKALADQAFRDELLKSPRETIQQSGLDISEEEINQIEKVDRQKARQLAENFAKEFGNRKQACM